MRRFIPVGVALAVAVASLSFAVPTATASPADSSAAQLTPTKFAMLANGYGTRVQGGQLPVQADTTAFEKIGCTNLTGLTNTNFEAHLQVPGLGWINGVTTEVSNQGEGNDVSVTSLHNVAKVVLGEPDLGNLTLTGVNSLSRAFHTSTGFHSETATSIARIAFEPTDGDPQFYEIPTPDQPLVIPGVARISIGSSYSKETSEFARAKADAINIKLLFSDSRVRIAHTTAELTRGITRGLFNGNSYGSEVTALDENLRSGPTPLSFMPCLGTKGETLGKTMPGLLLADQIVAGAMITQLSSEQNSTRATGFVQAQIESINLGDGQLVIEAIKSRVNVTRLKGGKVISDAKGTGVLSFTSNGEVQEAPLDGFEIPGVLRVETNIVEKTESGIAVTAVRIFLLDGSGAVVNLGHSQLFIKRSGL